MTTSVKNLIRNNATIIRITELHRGDLFKFIEKSAYGSPVLRYAVVNDILSDGKDAFIEALTIQADWSTTHVEKRLFHGDENLNIYPASIEDLKQDLKNCFKLIENSVATKEKELKEAQDNVLFVKNLLNGTLQYKLQCVDFQEISQSQLENLQSANKSVLVSAAESDKSVLDEAFDSDETEF